MKIKKTPQNKRGTYKLFDENNRLITEYKPGKDGVTELDILNLHKMDDHEVYVNGKEASLPEWYKPHYEEWKDKFIKEFEQKAGRKPFNDEIPGRHRQYESWEQETSDGDELGDSSRLEAETAIPFEEKLSSSVYRLREIVAEMPEQWQKVYQLVLIEARSKAEAGRSLGISDVRVGQIVRKISAAIANDEEMKTLYR